LIIYSSVVAVVAAMVAVVVLVVLSLDHHYQLHLATHTHSP
jgi:hypothetical protein